MFLREVPGSRCGYCFTHSGTEPSSAEAGEVQHMDKPLPSLAASVCAKHPSGCSAREPSGAANGSKFEDFSPSALLQLPAGGSKAQGLVLVASDPYPPYPPPVSALG